jgi:hydroxyethylthiazole kinase-like uncharacterized protein yjeF
MNDVTPELLQTLPLPDPGEGDKRTRGDVLVVGGARNVPGAILLAGLGALRAGAGRLQIATSVSNASALAVSVPEALVLGLAETPSGSLKSEAITSLKPLLERADCVLIGSGLNDDEETSNLTNSVLKSAKPDLRLIVDAGAIRSLRDAKSLIKSSRVRLVITPHAGEMAALMGIRRDEVEADPVAIAREAAANFNAVVVMKGACTYIASPENNMASCRAGNVGLATSGSGDVLAGVISGLAARGAAPFVACCWGVFLHGTAGERLAERIGPLGYLARELLVEIPGILGELCSQ